MKQNHRKRIKNSETEKNIGEINALWYRYSITYSVDDGCKEKNKDEKDDCSFVIVAVDKY